jgi:hypothetical protein
MVSFFEGLKKNGYNRYPLWPPLLFEAARIRPAANVSSSSGAHQPVLVGSTWLLKFQFSEK